MTGQVVHGCRPTSGDVTADSTTGNSYLYDAEGNVCAVKSETVPGTYAMTGYLYDATGIRIAKGTITSMSCDPTANGFQITQNYVLGPGGEELSMLDGNNNWQRTNVYAGGKLVGTYDTAGLHFHLEDPLGTRRMQLSGNPNFLGEPETDIQSLPFGDGLYSFPDQYAPSTADDATPLHFTGKERDQESGNDYFGARYYASLMGRFLSPDWAAKIQPVPYAKLDDPQTLDLYAYLLDNPLIGVDSDGHCKGFECEHQQDWIVQHQIAGSTMTDAQVANAGLVRIDKNFTPNGGVETLGKTAGVVAAETTSVKERKNSNMSVFDAQSLLGHERINAERKFSSHLDAEAGMMQGIDSGDTFDNALKAVIHAAIEDIQGIDPTSGALWYNMRTIRENKRLGDRAPSWAGGKKSSVRTRSGPYDTYSTQKFILTYGPKGGDTQ